jgi:hypothetical protein
LNSGACNSAWGSASATLIPPSARVAAQGPGNRRGELWHLPFVHNGHYTSLPQSYNAVRSYIPRNRQISLQNARATVRVSKQHRRRNGGLLCGQCGRTTPSLDPVHGAEGFKLVVRASTAPSPGHQSACRAKYRRIFCELLQVASSMHAFIAGLGCLDTRARRVPTPRSSTSQANAHARATIVRMGGPRRARVTHTIACCADPCSRCCMWTM